MKAYPIEDIKAPAYLFIDGKVIFMKDNVKVQKVSTRLDVPTSHNIKAGDILTDQAITIKGSPVAFSDASALFDELKLVKGAMLPKKQNCYIIARVGANQWVKWNFASAIHDTIGSITFGANLPLGEHGWTVYPDPLDAKKPLVTVEETTKPTIPAMTDAGKFMLRCLGIYGSGDDAINFDTSGASIDISLSTEDASNDRLIKYGKTLTDVSITAKFKPRNISFEDWQKLTGIADTDEIGKFTGVGSADAKALILRGEKQGDYQFTFAAARCKDPSATFSPKDALMDELSFEPLGDEFGDNKLVISTSEADFKFTETTNTSE